MPIRRFMRVFFHLLYHPFAFTYDLVAATVSFGRWTDWGRSISPYIKGSCILELGHGPGHLQRFLLDQGLFTVAIDESTQMGKLAKRRIGGEQKLTRGLAQALPYPDETFDTVIATFPTEYIFETSTLSEVKRVLRNGGRLVVLPVALPGNRFLQWLYKVTGQSPAEAEDIIKTKLMLPFAEAGFETDIQAVTLHSNMLLIVIATK